MEAGIISLSRCFRSLFPFMDMTNLISEDVGLIIVDTKMNVHIHENNSGELILAETLLPQFTPRSNNYASKTIWFCEEIHKRGVKLNQIATMEQLGDIFIKGLPRYGAKYLRKKKMGW